jgi:hypothetical protein
MLHQMTSVSKLTDTKPKKTTTKRVSRAARAARAAEVTLAPTTAGGTGILEHNESYMFGVGDMAYARTKEWATASNPSFNGPLESFRNDYSNTAMGKFSAGSYDGGIGGGLLGLPYEQTEWGHRGGYERRGGDISGLDGHAYRFD